MTIDEMIERSHAQAVKSGWWEGGVEARPVVQIVNNLHSEISEAWEEYRAGRMKLWFSENGQRVYGDGKDWDVDAGNRMLTWKPEGFFVEIADLLIRLADTIGAYGWKSNVLRGENARDIPEFIAGLHVNAGALYDWMRHDWSSSAPLIAVSLIDYCCYEASRSGVDLLDLCELKMAYNATRSHRHGGKKA